MSKRRKVRKRVLPFLLLKLQGKASLINQEGLEAVQLPCAPSYLPVARPPCGSQLSSFPGTGRQACRLRPLQIPGWPASAPGLSGHRRNRACHASPPFILDSCNPFLSGQAEESGQGNHLLALRRHGEIRTAGKGRILLSAGSRRFPQARHGLPMQRADRAPLLFLSQAEGVLKSFAERAVTTPAKEPGSRSIGALSIFSSNLPLREGRSNKDSQTRGSKMQAPLNHAGGDRLRRERCSWFMSVRALQWQQMQCLVPCLQLRGRACKGGCNALCPCL